MYNHVSERSGQKAALIADDVYEIIMKVFSVVTYACEFQYGHITKYKISDSTLKIKLYRAFYPYLMFVKLGRTKVSVIEHL